MKLRSKLFVVIILVLLGYVVEASETVKNGATNQSFYMVMRDRNDDPNTAITVTTLDMYYVEDGAAGAAKIDCTDLGSENAAHTDGGCYEIGTSGLYRFDFPDEAFDGGVNKRVNLWIDDAVTGTKTAFLCVLLSPPVDVISVAGTAQTANDNGADINSILDDTDDIGVAGAGLTAVVWNSDWGAEVGDAVRTEPLTSAETANTIGWYLRLLRILGLIR